MKIFYIPALLGKVLWPMNTQHFAKSIIIGPDRDDYANIWAYTVRKVLANNGVCDV